MATKVKELRGLIYSKYDSESELAEKIGWSRQRISKITNGVKEPDIDEIAALSKALGKSVGEIAEIFLRYKSPNGQQNSA